MLIQDDQSNQNKRKMSTESNHVSYQNKPDSSHLLCSFVWWTTTSLIASVLIAAGFWLPYWIQGFYENIVVSFSPFRRCNFPVIDDLGQAKIVFKCIRYETFDEIPSLPWKLTTILVGFGVLFSFLVALILLFSCCIPRALTTLTTFYLVLFQLLIILLIVTGCTLYPLGWQHHEIRNVCGGHHSLQLEKCHLSLSVYLLAIGLFLLFTCLIFGMITSRKLRTK